MHVENDEGARSDMRKLEMLVMVAIWYLQEVLSFILVAFNEDGYHMIEGMLPASVQTCP